MKIGLLEGSDMSVYNDVVFTALFDRIHFIHDSPRNSDQLLMSHLQTSCTCGLGGSSRSGLGPALDQKEVWLEFPAPMTSPRFQSSEPSASEVTMPKARARLGAQGSQKSRL